MNGNRFDFLEIGDENNPPARPIDQPAPQPAASRELGDPGPRSDALALAQVRVTDPRGYQAFLDQAATENSLAIGQNNGWVAHKTLRVVEIIGARGGKAGQFNFPTGLVVDRRGILFVADSYNHRVQRITPEGDVAVIGGRGSGPGHFLSPQAVATDSAAAFYIVEQGNHRIQKFARDGAAELMFGRQGSREGEFQSRTGIAVAPTSGDIYVVDTGNDRIQRFDHEGRFLDMIGGSCHLDTRLSSPQAMAIDAADNLYVADTFAHRVLWYDPLGRLAGRIGDSNRMHGSSESAGIVFHEPRAVACGPAGLLYIADSGAVDPAGSSAPGRVQVVERDGGHLRAAVEKPGRRLSPLGRPCGLAVMSSTGGAGSLYVADTMNHRILRFIWE